jgi:hypothetical protein
MWTTYWKVKECLRTDCMTKHLDENNVTYFQHLKFSWTVAFVLIVHGLFPFIWETKASEILCKEE